MPGITFHRTKEFWNITKLIISTKDSHGDGKCKEEKKALLSSLFYGLHLVLPSLLAAQKQKQKQKNAA